jgi:hypothetical protein
MRALVRDVALLRKSKTAALQEFHTQFVRYRRMDFFYAILLAVLGGIAFASGSMDDSEFGGVVSHSQKINAFFDALICFLFFVDGVLMGSYLKNVEDLMNDAFPVTALMCKTNLNITTNTATFLAYTFWRLSILYYISTAGGYSFAGADIIPLIMMIFILLSKLTKVLVLVAFKRRLAAIQSGSAPLVPQGCTPDVRNAAVVTAAPTTVPLVNAVQPVAQPVTA